MMKERQHRRGSEEKRFDKEVYNTVQRVEFRPYSRQSVDTSYNWEKGRDYHQIECFTGATMYNVSETTY